MKTTTQRPPFLIVLIIFAIIQIFPGDQGITGSPIPNFGHCPEVKGMPEFNIFAILGEWFVAFYFSSSEETLTYDCMRVEFGLSSGNMDMRMKLTYRYANDPDDEVQTGNMTWQIPDPTRPEHWRHTEDHYRGVYITDVVDTDYNSWLLLLHCSDPEPNKKYLSTFVLSRRPILDKVTVNYLKEKIAFYDIDLDYLFPVNQTRCLGDTSTYIQQDNTVVFTKTPDHKEVISPDDESEELLDLPPFENDGHFDTEPEDGGL